jgi:error-prone DNA polymerase
MATSIDAAGRSPLTASSKIDAAGRGYAELQCKTNGSFLTGASHPGELVARAAELGLRAIAIIDRDGMYGMPKAYREAKKHPNLKLIVGAEITLENRPPLALIARDRRAYGLLCRMISAAHAGREKGKQCLLWSSFLELMERDESSGLVALASGETDYEVLKNLFGERLYYPLHRMLDGKDDERTKRALELRRDFSIKILATNDVHYHLPARKPLQDAMTSIRLGTTLKKAGTRLFSNAERYLKAPSTMAELFKDLPEAIDATLEIADSCTFSPAELRYYYPSEWLPAGETAQSFLEKLVRQGVESRYAGSPPQDVQLQISHELKLINELRYADYFLTIWDIVEYARSKKILCQGRGSAANSVVCYCLGITAIDPVRMNLLFERFISVERGEPPDIDVDFEHERREEVIQYIYEKYGRHRAAMVAAVITYRSRSCKRELSKVLEVPLEKASEDPRIALLSDELYGFPRHLSIHSGGFTLSRDPLIETVPIEPARMPGRTIVQWDKDDLDAIGLLKVDVLSLGMLTALRKTCALVGGIDLATIPADDRATYDMICAADTVGTFQIESRAQINMLGRLKPRTFYDLVVEVAIVRPGPIVGKMVHPYLKRRRGLEPADVPHPDLKPILEKTLGVPLFQEQVMKIAVALAGFSAGEADELRRSMGTWRSNGSIDKLGGRLMAGLLKKGLPQEWVQRIFEQIKGFAEYGFPESHAASFALIAYASAYLKCHHPAEFTCSLLNSQPMGFYSPHTLVEDARHHGVRILPLDPRISNWDCEIEDGALRIGWRVVKGLGKAEADLIIAERERRPFQNLSDFCSRVRLRPGALQTLALGDAFICFGRDQRHTLWEILSHELTHRPEPSGQLSLFAGLDSASEKNFEPLDDYQAILADYSSFELSARGHPMKALRQKIAGIPRPTSAQAKQAPHGRSLALAGLLIIRQRPPTAAGTVFATLEDEMGFVDLILHKETYEKYADLFSTYSFLVARGMIQRDQNSASLLVKSIRPLLRDLPEVKEREFR